MNNKSTRTVLFDVDGTLTDSTYFHGVSWWQALRQSGITSLTAAIHRAVGLGGQERLHHFLSFGTAPEQADALNEAHDAIFSTHRPALIPFSAAKELLEHGVPAGAAVVLASCAQKTVLNVFRRALDTKTAFTAATRSSDASQGNSPPDILAAVLDTVGSGPAHACLICRRRLGRPGYGRWGCQ